MSPLGQTPNTICRLRVSIFGGLDLRDGLIGFDLGGGKWSTNDPKGGQVNFKYTQYHQMWLKFFVEGTRH